MKNIILLLLFFIVPASYAQAGKTPMLGLAIGSAGQDYSDIYTDIAGIPSVSGRDASMGIRLSIPVGDYVHLEGAAYDYGDANDNYIDTVGDLISVKMSTASMNVGMAGIIPLRYTATDFIGRLGLALWNSEIEFRDSSAPGTVLSDNDNGVSLYLGLGARTYITRNIAIGLEYMIFGFDTTFTDVAGDQYIDNFALTVDVGF